MKKIILFIGFLAIVSCKKDAIKGETENESIVGKWNNSYQLKTKDADGKWSEWTQINTFVALPTLAFTSDGKILWDGKQINYCCTPREYVLKGNVLSYKSGSYNCELALCVKYQNWIVEFVNQDTLVLDEFYTKVKYFRATK